MAQKVSCWYPLTFVSRLAGLRHGVPTAPCHRCCQLETSQSPRRVAHVPAVNTSADVDVCSKVATSGLYLDDGTVCGSHEATQACLTVSRRRPRRPGTSTPHSASTSWPSPFLPPSARGPCRMHDSTRQMLRTSAASGPSDFCLRKLQEKLDRAERLRTQLVRPRFLATLPRPPSLLLGWCQISNHARTMPRDSFLLCAQRMRPPFRIALEESFKPPSTRKRGSEPRFPPTNPESASQNPVFCCPAAFLLPAAPQPPFVTAFGTPTTTHTTQT